MWMVGLAAVLLVCGGLFALVMRWPWLIIVGLLVKVRLSPTAAGGGRDVDELFAAALGAGMPVRLVRWLDPRHHNPSERNMPNSHRPD